jgi:penicillin-binding protein 1C
MRYLLYLFLIFGCSKVPELTTVKAQNSSSFVEVYDQHGELLHETRINFKKHRRAWLTFKEVPEVFKEELLRFEDKRFYTHFGVDPLAIGSAALQYPKRGASTVSMQVAGLLSGKTGKRNLSSKFDQMIRAIEIENTWSKEQILEAYLNLLTFKGDLEGLLAGSLGIFDKRPEHLTQEERLLLIAMIPSPNQTKKTLLKRACSYQQSLTPMKPCHNLAEAIEKSFFDRPLIELDRKFAPHLAQRLKGLGSNQILTTLDGALQKEAIGTLRSHLRLLQSQNVRDGAILILERQNGEVKAYVGSSGDLSLSPHVDHVEALRQAGSTLKPLLFAQAISSRLITMTTPFKDEPFTITKSGITYQPENYHKSFTFKQVPAKVALGSSLNIPAIKIIDLVGPERFHALLSNLEMRSLASEEHYGHSMALGAVDVTLWDLTRAYHALAEGGAFRDSHFTGSMKSAKQLHLFNENVSFILSSILSEKENRYLTFGIQSSLSTDSWSAVKTGTSKDMRDNWCIGYTDRYVIGIWVGNSSGEPMWNVTGISGAAPIFSHLVSYLHQEKPSRSPKIPVGIVQIGYDYYLSGTEPRSDLSLREQKVKRIIFPQEGSQFAFDPEIPLQNQRIHFQSTLPKASWRLNGIKLTKRALRAGFLPEKKGKYTLELWENEKTLKDKITFNVKAGREP